MPSAQPLLSMQSSTGKKSRCAGTMSTCVCMCVCVCVCYAVRVHACAACLHGGAWQGQRRHACTVMHLDHESKGGMLHFDHALMTLGLCLCLSLMHSCCTA